MGHASGFWLTWYYFGYSPVYSTLLAAIQIVGALLLTFRRTALLGASILAPVFANIVVIDFCYGVDLGATLVAVFLLVGLLFILAPHAKSLWQLFISSQSNTPPTSTPMAAMKWFARVAILAFACGFTYWVANFNNRAPTPIDGTWIVKTVEPASAAYHLPSTLFFEYNRAHMAVLKFSDGTYQTHHFETAPNGTELKMWQRWLSKGDELFTGTYNRTGQQLQLTGKWAQIGPVKLTLTQHSVR